MHAGLRAVIYNAFETERGGVRSDDIAYREREGGEKEREYEVASIMDSKQVAQLI